MSRADECLLKHQISPAMQARLSEFSGDDFQKAAQAFLSELVQERDFIVDQIEASGISLDDTAVVSEQAKEFRRDADRLIADELNGKSFEESSEAVRSYFEDQLAQTNRFSRDVNRAYSGLMATFFSTQAKRLGVTPKELLDRYPLTVRADAFGGAGLQQGPTETKAFKDWFGDSKVVGEDGKPLVVYHGTNQDFDAFDDAKRGESTRATSSAAGFFFSADPRTSQSYADYAATIAPVKRLVEEADEEGDKGNWDGYDAKLEEAGRLESEMGAGGDGRNRGQNLVPVYLSLSNPLVFDAKGETPDGIGGIDPLIRKAQKAGHDGVIIKNFDDAAGLTEQVADHYIVFNPAQIKSATGNRGTFDPNDPNILRQSAPDLKDGPRKGHTRLFHGGNTSLSAISGELGPGNIFGGVFGSEDRGAAKSHGDGTIFFVDIRDEQILKSDELLNSIDSDLWDNALRQAMPNLQEEDFDSAYEAVIEDKSDQVGDEDLLRIFGQDSVGESSWEAQRVRGEVARILGYKAVEMADEHGVSFLILPGSFLNRESNDPNTFQQADGSRAAYSPDDGVISLFANADFSSFLHESGHFYLEVLTDLANQPDAPAEIKADMEATLKWFGVDSLEAWNGLDLDGKREFHEKFARGFEAFLFEGKTSNPELRPLFQRFRAWLMSVYRDIKNLGVELNDDVRGVFDRLISSEDQIRQAAQARGYESMFTSKEDAGMTEAEFTAYQARKEQAVQDALDKVSTRSLKDMKWLSGAKSKTIKALQREANDKRKAVREEITQEVRAEPVYAAIRFLKKGEVTGPDGDSIQALIGSKLSKEMVGELYSNPDGAPDLKKLRGMTGKEGLPPDLVAEMFGFGSGDQMIRAITEAPKETDAIRDRTDQRMLERYGDITSPEALEAAANDALTNKAHLRFLATELASVAGITGKSREILSAARIAAQGIISSKKVKDVRPRQYIGSEMREGRAAEKAMAKGDKASAALHKRRQILQSSLSREAMNAQEEVDKALRAFKRMLKGKDPDIAKRRDLAMVNAVRALLGNHGIGPKSDKAAEYLKVVEKNDPGMYALLEPVVNKSFGAADYRDLSIDEFRAMAEAVKGLWHTSRRSKQIEIDGQKLDRDKVLEELSAELANVKGKRVETLNRTSNNDDAIRFGVAGILSSLRRVEHFADSIGPKFKKFIFRPVSEGATQYRLEKTNQMRLFRDNLDKIAGTLNSGPIVADELNGFVFDGGKQEVIHALLHTGNQSNLNKLIAGNQWGEVNEDGIVDSRKWDAFVSRMIREGKITKADYDFVQSVWDQFESIKPQTQKAFHDMYGQYFDEITANPVVTPFGTYAGGYVPAKTDPNKVDKGQQQEESILQSANDLYAFPTAGTGATKSRVENYAKPLLLDLRKLATHIDWSLKFIHIQPRILDAFKLIKDRQFSAQLKALSPASVDEMLLPWLQRTAQQIVEKPYQGRGGRIAQKTFSLIRKRTSMQIMAVNLANSIQNLTAIPTLTLKVPAKYVLSATVNMTRSPQKTTQFILDKSDFMNTRMSTELYDIQQNIEDFVLNPSKYKKLRDWSNTHYYFLSLITQNYMDRLAWIAAYDSVAGQMSDIEAVRHADETVRLTQGSLSPEDISRFESTDSFVRVFTMFYSWFGNQAQLVGGAAQSSIRDLGVKSVGRLTTIYTLGIMVPSVLGEVVSQGIRGTLDLDSDDDDQWDVMGALSFFASSQARYVGAMIPFVGQAANAAINRFNDRIYDDRIGASPVVSALEASAGVPFDLAKISEDGEIKKKHVRDVMTLVGLITGLPTGALARPIGYALEVEQGNIEPANEADYVRGLVTGSGARN